MRIRKSLGLGLVIGLLAMAFAALPAIASAAPQLTTSKGATVPVGTTVSATSTNSVSKLNILGELACTHVEVHGIVTKNTGTEVEIEMDGPNDTATGCTLGSVGVSVTPTLNSIKLTTGSKTASFEFSGGGATEKTVAPGATVTYSGPGATSIHVAGALTGTVGGSFTGDFTLLNGITLD